MSKTVYKGQPQIPAAGAADDVVQYEWRRTGGPAVQIFREGSYATLADMVPTLQASYDSISIKQKTGGGWYRMECAQNGDGITEIHEVSGSNLSQAKNLSSPLRDLAKSMGIPEDLVHLDNDKVGIFLVNVAGAVNAMYTSNLTSPYEVTLKLVKDLIIQYGGTEIDGFSAKLIRELSFGKEYLQTQYTYRHTVVCAERYFSDVVNAAYFQNAYKDVHKIFTEAQLRTAELIPDAFPLPPQISDNTKPAEWLKEPSHSELTYNQKRTITSEYTFADIWSRLLYAEKK